MFALRVRRSMGLGIFLFALNSQAAVILGADANSVNTKATNIEKEYSQDMRDGRQDDRSDSSSTISATYPSTLKMREKRRVGAGVSVGGQLGLVGGIAEFNIEDADSVIAGFGTGPGYNSIQLGWKHAIEGDYIAPYYSASYSRWYNSSGSGGYDNSGVLDRVLTADEKRNGHFGTNFFNASLGLQYNQLSGELAGFSAFAEVVAMYEVTRSQLIPNGTIGALYYF